MRAAALSIPELPDCAGAQIFRPFVAARPDDLAMAQMLEEDLHREPGAKLPFERDGLAKEVLRAEKDARVVARVAARIRGVLPSVVENKAYPRLERPSVGELPTPIETDACPARFARRVRRGHGVRARAAQKLEDSRRPKHKLPVHVNAVFFLAALIDDVVRGGPQADFIDLRRRFACVRRQ